MNLEVQLSQPCTVCLLPASLEPPLLLPGGESSLHRTLESTRQAGAAPEPERHW